MRSLCALMTLSYRWAHVMALCLLPITARGSDIILSGALGGEYIYSNQSVTILNSILTADTTITVSGGSITVSGTINCGNLDGDDGEDESAQQNATSGELGGPAHGLALSTRQMQEPPYTGAGDIWVCEQSVINLAGGKGGAGGNGCFSPAGHGGAGGDGGWLIISSGGFVFVDPFCQMAVDGGAGGEAGGSSCDNGGADGGVGGDAGAVSIYSFQSIDFDSSLVYARGGNGGNGTSLDGAGADAGRGGSVTFYGQTVWITQSTTWAPSVWASGGSGGHSQFVSSGPGLPGGQGGDGGMIELFAETTQRIGDTIHRVLIETHGGNGGSGGHGGDDPGIGYAGGDGGIPGDAGFLHLVASGPANEVYSDFRANGGRGGNGGTGGTPPCPQPPCWGLGGDGGNGASGGYAGQVKFEIENDDEFILAGRIELLGGDAGYGGSGGSLLDLYGACGIAGDGGNGGGGNGGGVLLLGEINSTVSFVDELTVELIGGDSGFGGGGGVALSNAPPCEGTYGGYGGNRGETGGPGGTVFSIHTQHADPSHLHIYAADGLEGENGPPGYPPPP